MSGYVVKTRIIKVLCYLFLSVLFVVCVVPVYMLIINATRSTEQISATLGLFPSTYAITNFNNMVAMGVNIVQGIFNSLFIALVSTVLAVYFSMMTAYAITVYDFRFKQAFFVFILAMVMIPGQLYIIGFFQYVHSLGLLNSYIPLIVPSIAAAGTVFFFKQYFDASLVPELIQAARIDGAGELTIFNRIILPLAKPGAFTMGIFAFVASWNSFLAPLLLISDQSRFTLPLIVAQLNVNIFRQDLGLFYLGMAITIAPILVVYAIFSKHIVSGISLGSVKE